MTEIPNDFSYQNELAQPSFVSASEAIVTLRHLTFAYQEDSPILQNFNLTIPKGTFLGIAGPSGCGKSSLIKAICKLEPYQETSVGRQRYEESFQKRTF